MPIFINMANNRRCWPISYFCPRAVDERFFSAPIELNELNELNEL